MSRYEIDFLPDNTDGALLDELRRIAELLPRDEPLTKTAFRRFGAKVSAKTLSRRFGGWKQALQKAGLEHLYVGQPICEKTKRSRSRAFSPTAEKYSRASDSKLSCGTDFVALLAAEVRLRT